MLQKAGGLFQLLSEVDFGTAYGIKALTYKTRTSNVADAGQFRLARADVINWRNQANSANLSLGVSASDVLQFNGTDIQSAISVSDTATIDLTLTGSALTADIVAASITNSMISNSAAIAFSKLAALSSANILVGSAGNVATSVAMSGDITISNAGVTAIGVNKVTLGMMAQVSTARFLGRTTASTGDVESLSATQATALLNNVVGDAGAGGTKGLVPAPGAGDAAANKFLKADGTWTSPSGAGDVVGPASSTNDGFAKFDGITGKLLKNSAATLVNADISASAAIAYSKLALTDSILNADINSAAAIAFSKLAALPDAQILVGSAGNVATAVAVTGDISISNAGVTAYVGTMPLNKGGTGQTTNAAAFDALSPMTTGGDLIYGGASGTNTRLANGSDGQYLKSTGGTSAPAWQSFTKPTIQRFTSGSGTYTTPAGVAWIRVKMAGGGAGGVGGGSASQGVGTAGGNSYFRVGASPEILLAAGGGVGSSFSGGAGGAATVNSPAISVVAVTGGSGGNAGYQTSLNDYPFGAQGGGTPLGSGGASGGITTGGVPASNTGGGGGGGTGGTTASYGGGGGGAGAYIDAIIQSPGSTYTYAVGAAGFAGTAGTGAGAAAGGGGAAGYIVVEEYYQ